MLVLARLLRSIVQRPLPFTSGRRPLPWLFWAFCALLLAACGGGGGVGEGGTGGSRIYSSGQVTALSDTSVGVDGVEYDRRQAQLVDGFGQAVEADRLALGSWVEVEGTTLDDGRSGAAGTIKLQPAARGVVAGVDPSSGQITVLGSPVRYDGATVVDGVGGAAEVQAGDFVEVHGALADDALTVQASRIEKLAPPPPESGASAEQRFELKGEVSQLNSSAQTMRVGGQKVSFAQARITVKALVAGHVVRVSAGAPPAADGTWVVDRVVDDRVLSGDVPWVYAQGVVRSWATGPVFALEGLPVDARQAQKRGLVTGNGLRVAVVGSLQAGVLVARAVSVFEPGEPVVFVMSGQVKKYSSLSDFRIGGVRVDASRAQVFGGRAADLAEGRKVRVKGRVQGQVLVATSLEFIP